MLAFERTHPLVACILYLLVWLTVSGITLWPFSLARIIDRLPFVLILSCIILAGAVDVLPEAFPRTFAIIMGHSIYAIHRTDDAGTLISMPWLEAWEEGADTIFVWVTIAGGLWGLA